MGDQKLELLRALKTRLAISAAFAVSTHQSALGPRGGLWPVIRMQWRALVIRHDRQNRPKQSGWWRQYLFYDLFNNEEIFLHQNYIYFQIKKYLHV
jgi:hypothetical protein